MKTYSPLFLLAALGVLSPAGAAAAAVDTSEWKCESCPFPKGTTGAVEAGVGVVSDDSATFGNYTGLESKGGQLLLGGTVSHRGPAGYFADLRAADLGLDTRSLAARVGREGLYSLRLGYAEIPRYFADGARTPFLGIGGDVLTLPAGAGFPAGDTASMPLASTLRRVELGYNAKRFELGGSWVGQRHWTYRVSLRRDVRDGSKPGAGSFYSSAAQLALPVDETTDQLELGVSYATRRLQATLGYQLSQFRNGNAGLTWDNPFTPPVLADATQGQLALAPDNQFQQVFGSLGYQVTPTIRASADVAYGRGTQNADYLAPTLTASLAPSVPGLPASSLDGLVTTFNFNAKLSAAPLDGLRLNAIYARDVRDNETAIQAYPAVATDIFVSPTLRSNTPFDLTQDRIKLNADYRGFETWKLSGGIDWDRRDRNFQEAVTTRETTLWGRASVQPMEELTLALKLSRADRSNSTYGSAYWFGSDNNPLMRKINLAARERGTVAARADWTVSETLSLGLGADWSKDDYDQTQIGLTEAESLNVQADASLAVSEETSIHGFLQSETTRSRQAGSQAWAAPDWHAVNKDRFDLFGLGVKHAAIPDKLDLGADLSISRARSDVSVRSSIGEPPFPAGKTSLDAVKLYASYKLNDRTWINGAYWYQSYRSADWRLDGVQPDTVYNLLAFGNQAPRYNVNVLRVSVRYAF